MKKKKRNDAEEQSPVVDEPTSEAKSFGPWLRRQREGRDIELRDIAQASKISLRYLDALENNRFEALPAELFTKGFLRQYASFVGLDAEEVVNYYLAAKSAADEAKAEDIPEELRLERRGASRTTPIILLLLLLLGLAGAGFWWFTQRSADDGPATSETPTAAPSPAPTNADRASGGEAGGETAPQATDRADGDRPAGAPSGDLSPDNAPPSRAPSDSPAPEGAPAADRPATRVAGAPTGAPIQLVLDFTADCWVEASIDGQNRVAEMRVQGESIRLSGTDTIEVMVGNINAVEMELNGQTWNPPGRAAPVRRFRVGVDSAEAISSPAPTTEATQ